jgi:hypothetical protein
MSLDDLANRPDGPRWQECGVAYALRILPPDQSTALRRALANENVQHEEIAGELRPLIAVEPPSAFAIGRHRATPRKCKCGDES